MQPVQRRARGAAAALAASVLWGTTYIAFKFVYNVPPESSPDPLLVTSARYWVGALTLYGLLWASRWLGAGRWRGDSATMPATGADRPAPAGWRMILTLLGLGTLGCFVYGVLAGTAAKLTAATNVTILTNANALWILPMAALIGERVRPGAVLGSLIGFGGTLLIFWAPATEGFKNPSRHDLLGCTLALSSGFVWAAYTVLGKGVARQSGGLRTSAFAMAAGAFLTVCLWAAAGTHPVLLHSQLLWMLYLGALPTGVAYGLWYVALEHMDSHKAGVFQYLVPIITILLAHFLLGESLTATTMLGVAIIFLGVYLVRP